jgi:hypothetical protein
MPAVGQGALYSNRPGAWTGIGQFSLPDSIQIYMFRSSNQNPDHSTILVRPDRCVAKLGTIGHATIL